MKSLKSYIRNIIAAGALSLSGCDIALNSLRTYFTPDPRGQITVADYRIGLGDGGAPDLGIGLATPNFLGIPYTVPIPTLYIDWSDALGLPLNGNIDKQNPLFRLLTSRPEGEVYFASNDDVRNGKEVLSVWVGANNVIYTSVGLFNFERFHAEKQEFVRDSSLLVELVKGISDIGEDGTYFTQQNIKISPRNNAMGNLGSDLEGRRVLAVGYTDGNNVGWYTAELNVLDIDVGITPTITPSQLPPLMPDDGLEEIVMAACSGGLAAAVDDSNTPEINEGSDIRLYRFVGNGIEFAEIPRSANDPNNPANFVHHRFPANTTVVAVPGQSLKDPISYNIRNEMGILEGFQPENCRNFIITKFEPGTRSILFVNAGNEVTAEVFEEE